MDQELEKLRIEAEKIKKIEAARKDKEMEMEKEIALKKLRPKWNSKNRGRDHFTSLGAQREKFKS